MKFIYVNTEGNQDRYFNVDHITNIAARYDALGNVKGSVINIHGASYYTEDTIETILAKIDQAPNRNG